MTTGSPSVSTGKKQLTGGPQPISEQGKRPMVSRTLLRSQDDDGAKSGLSDTDPDDGQSVGEDTDDDLGRSRGDPPSTNDEGMGDRLHGKDANKARQAHPMFEIFFDWMVAYRPTRNRIPTELKGRQTDTSGTAPRIFTQEI